MGYKASNWRPLIQMVLSEVWPEMPRGLHWIEAQVHAESGGVPDVVSPTGAIGLMQLEPSTAAEMGNFVLTDPKQNLAAGISYLHKQWWHLPEILDDMERLKWSWASYNCGRGYVNKALELAREADPHNWQKFDLPLQEPLVRNYLSSPSCRVWGLRPIWRAVFTYVDNILAYDEAKGE